MAGELQLYTGIYATIDDKLLAEEVSITIQKNSGSNPVNTVVKGFAGVSPGAGSANWTIEMAAPSADFEVNPDAYLTTNKISRFGAVMSGRQMSTDVFILTAEYTHGVNQEAKITITAIGPLKPWE